MSVATQQIRVVFSKRFVTRVRRDSFDIHLEYIPFSCTTHKSMTTLAQHLPKKKAAPFCPVSSLSSDVLTTESMVAGAQPRVAIIGGGLAGLAASVEILKHHGSVVIVEKCDRLGGNSAKASSGINAAKSSPQLQHGIEDNLDDFKEDTLRSGKGLARDSLVEVLVDNSASAIDFLQGFHIDLSSIARLGGHSHARTHRAGFDGKAMNVGYRIMSSLSRFLEEQPEEKAQIVKRARATQVLFDTLGRVRGVRLEVNSTAEDGQEVKQVQDIEANAVVLATGGFCADRSGLLSQHVPHLKDLATTNGPFATGDGVRMGLEAGAGLVDMDQVQLHPTAFVNPKDPTSPTKFLAPEALRGCGGILLNQQGQRFVNELATRDAVVAAILKSCGPLLGSKADPPSGAEPRAMPIVAYLLLNAQSIESFDRATVDFYVSRGLIQKFANASELCEHFSVPDEALLATLAHYGHTTKEDHVDPREWQEGMHLASETTPAVDDPFGKPTIPNLFSPEEELYVALITPALHYCMGGLRFDSGGRILREGGEAIPGLFGAGEVTGGVHGRNRLAGNSLLECVVFGRVAGVQAWGYAHAAAEAETCSGAALK